MANFMGPMAPPQAAPGQPPQLDIRTNPNQRQRFRNFMRQNTRPAGMTGVPPMYPAAQTPYPAAPMPPMPMPAPAPIMPMQMAQPMRPPMAQPMGPARNVDIFSPQYMQAQPPVGMADGGDVPTPTVVPNSKQEDAMLRIAYDEALRKGAVENALRQLETDRVIERSKEMELDRIRDIERQDRLDAVKRMRLEAELADRNYRLKGLLTPPDQGLEDDPVFALPIKREDGGSVPPRRVDIRGQDHMLSYITPEEAGILKALGGAGKPGPMGIPSYYDEGDGMESSGGDQAGQADGTQGPAGWGGGGGGGQDRSGMQETLESYAAEQAAIDAVNDMISKNANRSLAPTQKGPPMAEVDVLSEQEQETLDNMEENEEEERNYKSLEPTLMDRIKSRMTPENIGLSLLGFAFGQPLGLLGLTMGQPPGYVSGYDSVNANNPGPSPDGSDDIFGGGGDGPDPIIYPPVTPEVAPEPVFGSVMGGMDTPYVAPPSLPSPLVPSTRQAEPMNFIQPVGYGSAPTGAINPYAYLSAGFPVGAQFFADGGEVLDQAAGRFLEALTAA